MKNKKVAGASSSKDQPGKREQDAPATLVPELRFPDFREQWITEPMGNLYSYIPTNSFSRDKLNYVNGKTRNIHYGDIHTKLPALLDLRKTELPRINESEPLSKFKERSFCKDGDVIFADASEDIDDVGKCIEIVSTNDLRILSGLHTIHARQTKSRFIVRFAGHLFHSKGIRTQIQRESQGAKVLGISANRLSAINVTYPKDKAEQQKIADCLGSLDDLIAAHSRKLAALQDHKKGLLQQLFPAEGETTPKLRFPEFEGDGEWQNKPLGELGSIITGKTPSTKEAELWKGDVLFITPTDISERAKYQHETQRTVAQTKHTKILPSGSIVYTCIASVGKMAVTVYPSITNQQINAVVAGTSVNNEFLYYALANLTPWIKSIPASSTLPIINKTEFSQILIALPPEEAEQQKIANCLSDLDALITAQSEQIAALKEHKKGLMQKLFPNP